MMVYTGYSALLVCYGLLVLVVAGVRPPLLVRLLSFSPLVSLGQNSYFIYLWHGLIGWGLIQWWGGKDMLLDSMGPALIVVAGIAATWVTAIISGKFFEKPLVGLGHRLHY
jgi:peptidoglycan/LPS O-acetylase OafA/YrhL